MINRRVLKRLILDPSLSNLFINDLFNFIEGGNICNIPDDNTMYCCHNDCNFPDDNTMYSCHNDLRIIFEDQKYDMITLLR